MPALFLLLVALPIAELWVLGQVAARIGWPYALTLLLLVSASGAWLLKQQGLATWRRLRAALRQGRMPANEVTDGALILLGGALLVTPGFLTDAVGLVLLLPATRNVLKVAARKLLAHRLRRRFGFGAGVYDTVATTRNRDGASTEPGEDGGPTQLPRGRRGSPSGGSRDTR